MDNQSVISIDGMEVMANPDTHITERQLDQIRHEKNLLDDRKKDKKFRRRRNQDRKQERLENIPSSLSGFMDADVDKTDVQLKRVISPSVPMPTPVPELDAEPTILDPQLAQKLEPVLDVQSSLDMLKIQMANLKDFDKSPFQNNHQLDDDFGLFSPKPDIDRKNAETISRRNLTPPRSPKEYKPHFKQEFDKYMEDDVKFRIKDLENMGIKASDGFDLEVADKRRKEMEHWRMKLSLEEKELAENCSTFIAVGADLLEGLCDAINFHAFETKDLSKEMDGAITDGRFNSCIRQYANMGGNQFMKNPLMNFLTTFSSIALKNHLGQKKTSIMSTKVSSKRKKRTKSKKSAPSFVRNDNSSDDDSDQIKQQQKPSRKPRDYYPPPPMYAPYWNPYHTPPYTDHEAPSYYNPTYYRSTQPHPYNPNQEHWPTPGQRPTPPLNTANYPPPTHSCTDTSNHPSQNSTARPEKKKPLETKITPLENQIKVEPSLRSQTVTDKKTGKVRILMNQVTETLPIEQLSGTMSKFAPVLKRVQKNMQTSKKFEDARKELGDVSKPQDLFS
jgi:hypothetical protein